MSRRDERAVEDALHAAAQLLDRHTDHGYRHGLLRRAHDEALDPRTRGHDPGPITGTRSWRAPAPGDLALYDAYRHGAITLARALRRLHPDFRPPRWTHREQAPPVHDAQQIVRAIRASLQTRGWRCRASILERACADVVNITRHLDYLAGGRTIPAAPTCDTSNCTNPPQHGRRCWACAQHKQRHGQYPLIARSA